MDRSTVIYLVSKTYTADAIGQQVPTETRRKVFASVDSVTMSEISQAGEKGINPELVVKIFAPEYEKEEICEVSGVQYVIYRTYMANNEVLELYLEKRVGK